MQLENVISGEKSFWKTAHTVHPDYIDCPWETGRSVFVHSGLCSQDYFEKFILYV